MSNFWIQYRVPCCALLALSIAGCTPSAPNPQAGEQPQATAPALAPAAPAAPAPDSSQQLTAEQRRVRALIQQVDQAYALGEADYRKGKLPEAKIEFDRSVDLMLMSGIPIKSDPQLQD